MLITGLKIENLTGFDFIDSVCQAHLWENFVIGYFQNLRYSDCFMNINRPDLFQKN